ncbi:hypothetical protein [Bordetella ansorpii]|nr:hypothetical protein [Bordetella ansorpii]
MKIPFQPLKAGYGGEPAFGVSRIELAGGPGRYRATPEPQEHMLTASWLLQEHEYSAFMGFVRSVARTGGAPFLADLIIDDAAVREYAARIVPGTLRLVSIAGNVYTVSAQLEVESLPEVRDPSTDYWASVILFLAVYGSVAAAREVWDLLAKLVNEDLPHG